MMASRNPPRKHRASIFASAPKAVERAPGATVSESGGQDRCFYDLHDDPRAKRRSIVPAETGRATTGFSPFDDFWPDNI